MLAITPTTRAKIKGYLEGFIRGLVEEYKGREILVPTSSSEYLSRNSSNGELKPFQAALVPPAIIRINQFERGLLRNALQSLWCNQREISVELCDQLSTF